MRQWIGSALVQIMLVAYSALNHYLNQCWFIVNRTLRNKLQWNINRTKLFILENEFYSVLVVYERSLCELSEMFWQNWETWSRACFMAHNRVVIMPTLSLLAAPHIFILGLFEVFPPPGGYYWILIRKTAPLMNSERQLISWKACFHWNCALILEQWYITWEISVFQFEEDPPTQVKLSDPRSVKMNLKYQSDTAVE